MEKCAHFKLFTKLSTLSTGCERKTICKLKRIHNMDLVIEKYGLICSILVYKKREQGETKLDIMKIYHEYEKTVINELKTKKIRDKVVP